MSHDAPVPLISDEDSLRRLTDDLREAGSFALDTEFVRENTYRPELCLVQVATPELEALIDPLRIRDLSSLVELVLDPAVEKVVHAGEQDMEIFFVLGGEVPRNLFDTQVAAALCGHGHQASYARLVENLTGVRLNKQETFTDWAQRPLTPAQLDYAVADVRYLFRMRADLLAEIDKLGRRKWLELELESYTRRELYEKDPRKLYLRVKGAGRLSRRELAVLRELASWREAEAQRLNRPRGRILRDEVLLELARRGPTQAADLKASRGLHPRLVERSGPKILETIASANRLPEEDCPPEIERPQKDEDLSLIVDLLDIVLKTCAAQARVAPSYLGTRRELAELAFRHLRGEPGGAGPAPRLLAGWRQELVGQALVDLLEGRSHLALDPAQTRVVVREP